MKRLKALLLALVMIFVSVFGPFSSIQPAQAADGEITVRFHYLRSDGDYSDWDMWIWGTGADGTGNAFTGQDADGAYLDYTIDASATEVNYIVRKGGGAWTAKDPDGDRAVDISAYVGGIVNVYLTSGVAAARVDDSEAVKGESTAPVGKDITVRFHYKRTDGNYDGWDMWLWNDASNGSGNAFTGTDEYGKYLDYKTTTATNLVNYIIRQGGDQWTGKDVDADRQVNLSRYDGGMVHVYLVSGVAAADIQEQDAVVKESASKPVKDGKLTVRFHYNRKDSTYTGWNLWIWSPTASGTQWNFEKTDDYGTYLDYVTDNSATEISYRVRKGDWEEKDVDQDRKVDLARYTGGIVHVYLNQNKPAAKVDELDALIGCKVQSTTVASDLKSINVTLSVLPSDNLTNAFTLKDVDGNTVKIASVEQSYTSVTLKLEKALEPLTAYDLTFSDITSRLKMPEYYSTKDFEDAYTYTGDDLGATWTKDSTTFKVWAPVAKTVKLNLYKSGTKGTDDLIKSYDMTLGKQGVWSVTVTGDLKGQFYTYTADVQGQSVETIDPYARTSGVNGDRGMVIDLDSTDPEGWENDKNPNPGISYTDALIYELHVKDFSFEASSGVSEANRGKYLAFTEKGTKNSKGHITGIDYLKDLGVTHVHLLPTYDYATVDESSDEDKFNWGYDPENYNIPEGSYSTNPYDGAVRINEYKQMVMALHEAGISVIQDMVYNHVYDAGTFSMNVLTPGYFVRPDSNASGCGNDVASERNMVRKFIVESVVYWAEEYHIDGFRFDLVGLIDTDTINQIVEEVHKIDPSIIFYGEGWDMPSNITKDVKMANQKNANLTPDFAYFSDNIRDSIKGDASGTVPGYINGDSSSKAAAMVSNLKAQPGWELNPTQVVTYESCHDNLCIYDKIQMTTKGGTEADFLAINKLAAAIVYTSQGIAFIHAGEEILRTKEKADGTFEHNSYKSPSSLNSIKWDDLNKTNYKDAHEYYKGLIAFRKAHAALRMTKKTDVDKYMSYLMDGTNSQNVIAFQLSGDAPNEISDGIVVAINPSNSAANVSLPSGTWTICVNEKDAGLTSLGTATSSVSVAAKSAMVLCKGDLGASEEEESSSKEEESSSKEEESSSKEEESTEAAKSDYFIAMAGSGLFAKDWAPADPSGKMTEISAGVWELKLTGVKAGSYEYKYTYNGDWAHSWGADGAYNGANYKLDVENDGSVVTFTVDLSKVDMSNPAAVSKIDATVKVSAEEEETTSKKEEESSSKEEESTSKEEETTEAIKSDYFISVAGSGMFANDWAPADPSGKMTEISAGVWELKLTGVKAGSYEYKYTYNGDWAHSWGADGAYNGANYKLDVENDGSVVTFTVDLSKVDMSNPAAVSKIDATVKVSAEEEETTSKKEEESSSKEEETTSKKEEETTSKKEEEPTDKPGDDASEGIIVRFHYQRPDNNYDDWDMWIWTPNADGTGNAFTGTDDFGVYLDYMMDTSSSEVSYIVRRGGGSWLEKDPDGDRKIDLTKYISGTVHVYLTSGVATPEIVEKDALIGCKIKATSVQNSWKKIVASLSMVPESDVSNSVTITDADKNKVETTSVTLSGTTVTIELKEALDPLGSYFITFDGLTYSVTMPDYYSSPEFENEFTYAGDDLGANWTKTATTFKVWAPAAKSVKVNLYKSGTEGTKDLIQSTDMTLGKNGVWSVTVDGDLNGTYYTYTARVNGKDVESIDPYARTAGVNGKRGMVVDLDSTDPEGWDKDSNPNPGINYTDAIIYELHVRDFSYEASSGVSTANRGKYLAFTEKGTKNTNGLVTGIDYLKDLGITHVHLLPTYDYATVDETKLDTEQFNWGYDPQNYNIPEGSYSTNPYNGAVRINEYKQMVMALHEAGISVVQDMVYNHVYDAGTFSMNVLTPGYFVRPNSNASGCGNDVASERNMVRKFIVESVLFWAEEYHIDGFRFDLVGLIDTETINQIVEEVHKIDPSIIFYGEGWTMNSNVTKSNVSMANQSNSALTPGFAYFNDRMRDAIKGGTFEGKSPGYVNGAAKGEASRLVASLKAQPDWTKNPLQSVNYESCHDNYCLYDKLQMTCPNATDAELLAMNKLAAALVYTSQGIAFIHAGEEILRSKELADGTFDHNSYRSPSTVNSIKWDDLSKADNKDALAYYKGLIAFRKEHAALRMTTTADVNKYMSFIEDGKGAQQVVAFQLSGDAPEEISDGIVVIYNPSDSVATVTLPSGTWKICVNEEKAGLDVLGRASGDVTVAAKSCMVLCQGETGGADAVVTDISDTKITLSKTTAAYTGKEIRPTVTVKDGSMKLTEGTDYVLTYKNNKAMGYASIIVAGKGAYTGTKTVKFKIVPQQVKSLKQPYYGTTQIKMTWAKQSGVDGYTVYRATSKNGSYKTMKAVTGTTYADTSVKTGSKYYYKVRAYKLVDGQKLYGAYSEAKSMVSKPSATTVSLTAAKKAIKIKWTKAYGSNGYEVYMATSRYGTYKRIKNSNSWTFSYTKSNLKSGQRYYFKIRSYKNTATGSKVYSGWSSVKAISAK